MPKIYSEEKRSEIRTQLMNTGIDFIKTIGYKRMSIEGITKKVGIAQGTFYHFFKSKEIFLYEIAKAYQEELNAEISCMIQQKGHLIREDLQHLYRRIFLLDEKSVYRYLSREDIQIILTRLPSEYAHVLETSRTAITSALEYIPHKKACIDTDVIFNLIQMLNLAVENRDLLSEVAFEKTVNLLIDALLNEIFDK